MKTLACGLILVAVVAAAHAAWWLALSMAWAALNAYTAERESAMLDNSE